MLGPTVLVVVALVLVAVHVRAYPVLSPIDELQHIDSLYRGSRAQIVRPGERVGEEAMREQSCRGLAVGYPSPPCDARELRPEQYQEEGFNTTHRNPPTYYWVTGLAARALAAAAGGDSLVTPARLLGAVWLAAGLLLTWRLGRMLGARPAALLGTLLWLAASPYGVFNAATVSPDAAALLVGAALPWAVLAWERAPGRYRPLVLAGLAVGAVKLTHVVVLAAAGVYLAVRLGHAARRRGRRREAVAQGHGRAPAAAAQGHRRAPAAAGQGHGRAAGDDGARCLPGVAAYARGLAVLVAASVASTAAWLLVLAALAPASSAVDPMTARYGVDSIGFSDLLAAVPAFLPVDTPPVATFMDTPVTAVATLALHATLLAGAGAAVLTGTGRLRHLAVGLIAALLLGGPVLVLGLFLGAGAHVDLPVRYVVSLLPGLAALLAARAGRLGAVLLLPGVASAVAVVVAASW